jgi:hypothetical protein
MTNKGFGTLANLAKILEDATDPESQVREDRRESKPKPQRQAPPEPRQRRPVDPKRKAWHERRLREQAEGRQAHAHSAADAADAADPPAAAQAPAPAQATTRATAASVSGGLQSALAAAKDAKPKDGSKRPEPWKRKPGDPFF